MPKMMEIIWVVLLTKLPRSVVERPYMRVVRRKWIVPFYGMVIVVHKFRIESVDYYIIDNKKKMSSTNDKLLWMTSQPKRAAMVGVNLLHRAQQWNLKKPPCVVFDVDATLILNHPSKEDVFKTQKVGKALFQYAAQNNVPIYLLTARAKSQWSKNYLVKQLQQSGYDMTKVKGIYMQAKAWIDNQDGGAVFKKAAREKIGQTHTIVVNAGDRWSDVVTAHKSDALPNQVPYTDNIYVGIKPAESHTLYSMKFPDE